MITENPAKMVSGNDHQGLEDAQDNLKALHFS